MEQGNGASPRARTTTVGGGLGRRHGRGPRRRRMLPVAIVVTPLAPPPPPAFTLVVIIAIPARSLLVELVPLDSRPRVRGPPAALEPPDAQRGALCLRLPAAEAVGDAPAVDFDAL